MMNLFSIFDPSTSLNLKLNWISIVTPIFLLPFPFWLIPSHYNILHLKMNNYILMELKILLNKFSQKNLLILISMFNFIMLVNFLGLFPYIFTPSSHLIFTLSFSLPLWLSFMIFGWMKNYNNLLIHLIPLGTPNILMPFMVIIETISNIIRPGTLAIRLSANMIAGHLLLNLIGSANSNIFLILIPVLLVIQTLLMILEISVSFIQAYVFSVLSTLYSNEAI